MSSVQQSDSISCEEYIKLLQNYPWFKKINNNQCFEKEFRSNMEKIEMCCNKKLLIPVATETFTSWNTLYQKVINADVSTTLFQCCTEPPIVPSISHWRDLNVSQCDHMICNDDALGFTPYHPDDCAHPIKVFQQHFKKVHKIKDKNNEYKSTYYLQSKTECTSFDKLEKYLKNYNKYPQIPAFNTKFIKNNLVKTLALQFTIFKFVLNPECFNNKQPKPSGIHNIVCK